VSKIIYKGADASIRESDYTSLPTIDFTKKENFSSMKKDKLFLYLLSCFDQGIMPILYDKNIRSIKPRIERLDLETIPKKTAVLFFTSGTTGEPTGALKTSENILAELAVLKALFFPLGIERVVVTVPLIHIYGFLAGVMLPKVLGVEVVLKEEFLPHELIALAEDKKTLCITNPVFLKVLNKLNIERACPHITFVSSTGRLDASVAQSLQDKMGCNIYQLFGSTETGGIAYKKNSDTLWKPLQGVKVEKVGQNLSVQSPFISEYILEDTLQKLAQPFVTTDIINLEAEGFLLLGRESEIIKISGKRISLLEIETLLEGNEEIDEVLVKLSYGVASHKDEQLYIIIVSNLELIELKKIVKRVLQENYKKINIRSTVQSVDKIPKNHMGKKLRKSL
jgi:acyl-coenzyme A synthetase/AMP-(fatty) acid ligase